ncbi:hypothetical protein B9G69_017050 [Bdellovibrio sp. SKB1291214]|uniref:hypothetical protein n=1 Tax=Bdellovibrio sp. SKB1291214 TaxID=1732569 RepID=UPI00223F8F5F|nr:hypothetical protein [Bdellovibrio sp. SKB1291214]UYL08752.1 hypothetical protein B9G69_017050 [Bdellovibrio sp. SKB1291214]
MPENQENASCLKVSKVILFAMGLLFSCVFFTFLTMHNDHVQMLLKAFRVIDEGQWSHFGNATTGMGFLPGSFLTAVSAIPMQIYFSPYSALAVILLFHVISYFLFADVLKKNFKPIILVDFLLLYWLSPWRVEQTELYNPAYLFLFSAVHFYTSYHMNKKSFWMTFFHVMAVGFCVQVHFSVLMLGLLSLALWGFRYLKVNWWGFIAGSAVVGLSLVPWFLAYLGHRELAVTVNKDSSGFIGKNFVLVYPVLKGISYWIRYGAISYGRHIFSEINFLWIQDLTVQKVVGGAFHGAKYLFSAVTVVFSAVVQWRIFKNVWKQDHPFRRGQDRTEIRGEKGIYLYAFYFFCAMIVATGLSPVEFNHWHLILAFPIITVLITIAFNKLRDKMPAKRFKWIYASILVVFCMFNIFGALGSRVHSYQSNFHREVLQLYKEYHEFPENKTNNNYLNWHREEKAVEPPTGPQE